MTTWKYGSTVRSSWRATFGYDVARNDATGYAIDVSGTVLEDLTYNDSTGSNFGSGGDSRMTSSYSLAATGQSAKSGSKSMDWAYPGAFTWTWAKGHSAQTVTVSFSYTAAYYYLKGATIAATDKSSGSFTFTVPAKASYTVSFNANGGSGAPSAQTKWYGETLALSTVKPTRAGYAFKGWATSSTGAVSYQPGGSYTGNAALTLYAVWDKLPAVSVTSVKRVNSSGAEDAAGGYALVGATWTSESEVRAVTVAVGSLSEVLGKADAGTTTISERLGDGTNVYPLTGYDCSVSVTNSAGTVTATYALEADPGYFKPTLEVSDVRRAASADASGDALARKVAAKLAWEVCGTPSQTGPASDISVQWSPSKLGGTTVPKSSAGLSGSQQIACPNEFAYADIPPTATVHPVLTATVSDRFYSTTVTADLQPSGYAAPSVSNVEVYRSGFDGTAEDEGLTGTVTVDWSMYVTDLNPAPESFVLTAYDSDGTAVARKSLSASPSGSGTVQTTTRYTFTEFDKTSANTGGVGQVFHTDSQYTVTVEVSDLYASATRSAVLTTAYFTFDVLRGGHGAAFGKPATREALDVRMDSYFENGVDVSGRFDAHADAYFSGEVNLAKQAHVAQRLDLPTFTYSGKPALADAPCLPCIVVDVSDYSVWLYEKD